MLKKYFSSLQKCKLLTSSKGQNELYEEDLLNDDISRTRSRQAKQWEDNSSEDPSTPSSCVHCYEEKSHHSQETMSSLQNMREKSIHKGEWEFKSVSDLDRQTSSGISESVFDDASDIDVPLDIIRYRAKVDKKTRKNCDTKSLFSHNKDNELDILIKSRENDYNEVDEDLKVVIALSGYPKLKTGLQDMEKFKRCINDIIDMQMEARLIKKIPTFLDCYINKGAIVCVFKDIYSKRWTMMVLSGLQERMNCDLILLGTETTQLYLARMIIPHTCWPANAIDAFKVLQYFNPELKTDRWEIVAKKKIRGVEYTSFLIDYVSSQIIRSLTFKNVIDYSQMEFEISGFTEIYSKSLSMEEDLSSVSSRVNILNKLRSHNCSESNKSINKNARCDKTNSSTKKITVEKNIDNVITTDKSEVKEIRSDKEQNELKKLLAINFDKGMSDPKESQVSGDLETIVVLNEIECGKTTRVSDQEETVISNLYTSAQVFEEQKIIDVSNRIECENTLQVSDQKETVASSLNTSAQISEDQEAIEFLNDIECENTSQFSDREESVASSLNGSAQMSEEQEIIEFSNGIESENATQLSDQEETDANCIYASAQMSEGQEKIVVSNDIEFEKTTLLVSDQEETNVGRLYASNTSSFYASNASSINSDSKRGIAYCRRTNYSHIDKELKIAVVLEGYPLSKLEWKHMQQIVNRFKELVKEDAKSIRFCEMIIPKFLDVYLSNGAVIHICDSVETKEYLVDLLPTLGKSIGLELTFRNIKHLVRFTRVVMTLPKEISQLESQKILLMLQLSYPALKTNQWKRYCDITGNIQREFGVDRESLKVLKKSEFITMYEGHTISFEIMNVHKANIKGQGLVEVESTEGIEIRLREKILKMMYCELESPVKASSLSKIRKNHYHNMVPDDFKLYISSTNYPEIRLHEVQYNTIKKTLEDLVADNWGAVNAFIPKMYDLYLYEGAIFIICKDILSRYWIESNIENLSYSLEYTLKATEYRGAIGTVNMVLKTKRSFQEVVTILQRQNPRLRTKFWRKISTVKSDNLDVDLQMDILSAQVINNNDFNGCVDNHTPEFKLGYLQTLLEKKGSLQAYNNHEYTTANTVDVKCEECMLLKENENRDANNIFYYKGNENYDLMKSIGIIDDNDYCKVDLKIPAAILPAKGCLDIIFNLIGVKNPKLNTDLWKVEPKSDAPRGHFSVLIDKLSAYVIKGDEFDSTFGGEELVFQF